jgi:quercetin dioxygenase-like cupin family protein
MSLPKAERIRYGSAKVVIYDFAYPADCLPMHRHVFDLEQNHITIVARGSFVCKGSGWQKKLVSGDIVAFEPEQWHELIALENNSRVINVITGPIGTPERELVTDQQR